MSCPQAPATDALGSELRALFTQLQHGGDLDASALDAALGRERVLCGEAGRSQHGTRVRFQLRVRLPDRQLLEVRYRAYGCPYTLATCEWLARRLSGRTLAALSRMALMREIGGATDWAQTLSVPAVRLGRLLIIEDALRAALTSNEAAVPDPAAVRA